MKRLMLLAALLVTTLLAQAQVVQVKGVGTVPYNGPLLQEIKDRAYVQAQLAAVERYFAENGESESQNFESIEPKIEENLDKFILNTTVINEQDQTSLHKYSIAVRVELNVAKLRNTLRGASNVSKASNSAKSQLVYLFVGRSRQRAGLRRTSIEAHRSGGRCLWSRQRHSAGHRASGDRRKLNSEGR